VNSEILIVNNEESLENYIATVLNGDASVTHSRQ